MQIIDHLITAARKRKRTVVLPEGNDTRIQQAAQRLRKENIARPMLLGKKSELEATAQAAGLSLEGISTLDPGTTSIDRIDIFAREYLTGRPGSRIEIARRLMRKPLFHGAMLVKIGEADALVAGVSNPTARVIEAGLLSVGMAEGINTPSSFFLMVVPNFNGEEDKPFIFADCAVNINPTAEELADIALASAASASKLLDEKPRIALLSFSTKGSARHELVDKVTLALEIARSRAPELAIDGEFQADSALIANVATTKVHEMSSVAGKANVLIFPDLNAGNISYKLTQYLAGASAIGPVLQGFAKPVCDLSRGASVDDIVSATAIALTQAQ